MSRLLEFLNVGFVGDEDLGYVLESEGMAEDLELLDDVLGLLDEELAEAEVLAEAIVKVKDIGRKKIEREQALKFLKKRYKGRSPYSKGRKVLRRVKMAGAGKDAAGASFAGRSMLSVTGNRLDTSRRSMIGCRECKCKNYVCRCKCVRVDVIGSKQLPGGGTTPQHEYTMFTRIVDMRGYRKRKLKYMKLYRAAKRAQAARAKAAERARAADQAQRKREAQRIGGSIKRSIQSTKAPVRREMGAKKNTPAVERKAKKRVLRRIQQIAQQRGISIRQAAREFERQKERERRRPTKRAKARRK